MTRKDALISCFDNAMECHMEYVGLLIGLPNKEVEITIIPSASFESKINYIGEKYTDDLELKACKDIKILMFTCADTFDQVENDFLQ